MITKMVSRRWGHLLGALLICAALILMFVPSRPATARGEYILIAEMDGAIVPAMENYLERVLEQAEEDKVELVILQLDTPGGSIAIMENMIQMIRESPQPIVVYVYPRGAMAASAGALITLAGHASAMAPESVIGAASPISGDGSDLNETADRKTKNILLANVRALTENRPPAARELAEKMITDADAVSVSEALEIGLIDYIAGDTDDLIRQLDGKTLLVNEQEDTLELSGLRTETLEMTFIERLLLILTDPTLVFFLLSAGVLLLVVEFRTPGGFIAGTLGAVCLLLSVYGLGVLPINFLGLAFVVLAFGFFVVEVFTPGTQGGLSLVGAIMLAVGGIILFSDNEIENFGGVSTAAIIGQSALIGIASAAILYFALRHMSSKETTGAAGLVGLIGETRTPLAPRGKVFVNGEWWNAESTTGAYIGDRQMVRITEIQDLLLRVEPDVRNPDEKLKD